MLTLAEESLKAEEEHLLHSVNNLLDRNQEFLETQLEERLETLDTFFEGLSLEDETDTRDPGELLNELSNLLRYPVNLPKSKQRMLTDEPEEAAELIGQQLETYMVTQGITRLVGSVERRLGDSLDLNPSDLAGEDWEEIAVTVLNAVQNIFANRRNRLVGENGDGQIGRELETRLSKANGDISEVFLLNLLLQMPQGAVTTFDKKTHRKVTQRTTRLTYAYFAAQFMGNISPEELTEKVLTHLEAAKRAVQQVWGINEWGQVSEARFDELNEGLQMGLRQALGEETIRELGNKPLKSLQGEQRGEAIKELGRHVLTSIYRQLLLRVISDLWVDYLTQMEALRVAIGLEAYAQRDPLVQYKARAYEMFQTLSDDIRSSVVTRMFTFQPQTTSSTQQTTSTQEEAPEEEEQAPQQETPEEAAKAETPQKSKRKRRRRRRK